jgi:hypothetical protein
MIRAKSFNYAAVIAKPVVMKAVANSAGYHDRIYEPVLAAMIFAVSWRPLSALRAAQNAVGASLAASTDQI